MTRGPCTCCSSMHLNKGPWTPEEDQILSAYIKRHGDRGNWRKLPKTAGLMRCGKSCRLRWLNYLRPDLKRGSFSEDEADLIITLHSLLGNRWSIIAGRIPGRSDNEIKNYWNFHLSKKLLSMGINPKNHKPLNTYNQGPNLHGSSDKNPERNQYISIQDDQSSMPAAKSPNKQHERRPFLSLPSFSSATSTSSSLADLEAWWDEEDEGSLENTAAVRSASNSKGIEDCPFSSMMMQPSLTSLFKDQSQGYLRDLDFLENTHLQGEELLEVLGCM